MILYGISNCDTVRKARKFLEQAQLSFEFHDFRQQGLTPEHIQAWLKHCDYDQLINKRSTSWKQLTESERQAVDNQDLSVVCQYPTLIKRPVLQLADRLLIGFNLTDYQAL